MVNDKKRKKRGESQGRWKGMNSREKRQAGGGGVLVEKLKKKSETENKGRPNIQLSSARHVAMNTSGGTFNTELKLVDMALLLL